MFAVVVALEPIRNFSSVFGLVETMTLWLFDYG